MHWILNNAIIFITSNNHTKIVNRTTKLAVKNLAETLRKARLAKGLTQAQLSDLLQAGQSYLSQVERGKHDIKTSTLIEWARVLDLEVMLIPRQHVPAVSYLNRSDKSAQSEELPPAYGPLPDEV